MIGLLTLIGCAVQVAAHGYVAQIQIGDNWYPGWNSEVDPFIDPPPIRSVRRTVDHSSYISDVNSTDITCSIGNQYLPAGPTLQVAAGDIVNVHWNIWPLGHPGPVLNYMAKCEGNCSTFRGDTGTPWFKISQDAFHDGKWANERLVANNFTWPVTIPNQLAPGDYLLRYENLALHGGSHLGGAQFYPVCIQLTVTGEGTVSPTGNLAFPGAYSATDPGILFNPYNEDEVNDAYIPPGGPVYQF